jgi:hypothetical protein
MQWAGADSPWAVARNASYEPKTLHPGQRHRVTLTAGIPGGPLADSAGSSPKGKGPPMADIRHLQPHAHRQCSALKLARGTQMPLERAGPYATPGKTSRSGQASPLACPTDPWRDSARAYSTHMVEISLCDKTACDTITPAQTAPRIVGPRVAMPGPSPSPHAWQDRCGPWLRGETHGLCRSDCPSSFAAHRPCRRRPASGVGAALLTTFAGGAITTVIHRALDANDWTYVPPPPPRPVPEPKVPPRSAPAHIDTTPPLTPKLGPATPLEPVAPFTLPPIGDGPLVSPSGGPATLPRPSHCPAPRPPRSAPSRAAIPETGCRATITPARRCAKAGKA